MSDGVMEWRETDGHFVSFGLFIGFVDNKKNKEQQPSPLISPHLLLSGFGSLTLSLPLSSLLNLLFPPSLPPSPPSKGRLLHLFVFVPAGHIFCFFVLFFFLLLWYQSVCTEASLSS